MTTLDQARAVSQRLREVAGKYDEYHHHEQVELAAANTIDALIAEVEKQAKVDVGGKNCIKCGERLMSDLTKTCYACDHAETKVDVEPCCANWKAGTNCFADPYPNCPHLKVDVEPVKLSPSEDFCYCGHEISLQMVSGGAAPEGLYGRVMLQVKGEYVDYVPASTLAALRAENEDHIQQLRKEQLYVQQLADQLSQAQAENERLREDAARWRFVSTKGDDDEQYIGDRWRECMDKWDGSDGVVGFERVVDAAQRICEGYMKEESPMSDSQKAWSDRCDNLVKQNLALRAELEAIKSAEPVAWIYDWYADDGSGICEPVTDWVTRNYKEAHSPTMGCHNVRPLYTHPAPVAAKSTEPVNQQLLERILETYDMGGAIFPSDLEELRAIVAAQGAKV